MAPQKSLRLFACMVLFILQAQAQKIHYPADASTLLRATASDAAELLNRALPAANIQTAAYTEMPDSGIVLIYDDNISDNQACKVRSLGSGRIVFQAAEDNGLVFGIYQYLHLLGYRFYQPGSIWEKIPALQTPFRSIDTVFTCRYTYKTWFLSGGHNKWAMDQDSRYDWDTYFGKNGHAWALYQRRNGMLGAHRFTGHRGDLMYGDYLETLKNNACYVASYNGSRVAGVQSVPDVNNPTAMNLWSNAIATQYLQYRQTILSNKSIYPDLYRSFRYNQGHIGIEVPDGAQWANTRDAMPCVRGELFSETDQQFILANHTVASIRQQLPGMRYQVYAYDTHADFPSAAFRPAQQIDVQVIPTAFQFETSTKGLLNRWYGKNVSLSEYHYMNIAQWSGETPSFRLGELKNTLERISTKNAQGIVWEAAPSKFATLPYLMAANNYLLRNQEVDSSLLDFSRNMFGTAAPVIYRLLQDWGSADVVNLNNGIQDNRYKIPYYLKQVKAADALLQNGTIEEKQRLRELKAFLHYMTLYYNWIFEQSTDKRKEDKASALCLYLARVADMKIVNSYAVLSTVVQPYAESHPLFVQYNTATGSAYLQGNLPQITDAEIERDFISDCSRYFPQINEYRFNEVAETARALELKGLKPLETISVNIGYTWGKNYTNRSEFFIYAKEAGSFSIRYNPVFDLEDKGSINITVEHNDHLLGVLTDHTLSRNSGKGSLDIQVPAAGIYKLSLVSKYRAGVELEIQTRGNFFYRHDGFLGNTVENYRKQPESLPGYIYVPAGINRLFFSLNNSNPGGQGYAGASAVNDVFRFSGADEVPLSAKSADRQDSALFSIDLPANSEGRFIRAGKMEQYRLCLANVSNIYWYARKNDCCAKTTGNLAAFPNPGNGEYRLGNGIEAVVADEIQIFSAQGTLISTLNREGVIRIGNQPAGIYFFRAKKDGITYTGRLIKN